MAKKKIEYLTTEELAEISKKMARVRGSRLLPENATCVERAKYDLCEQMVIYMRKHDITQRQLAKKLGVSESRVSEIAHYYIHKITIDKLVELHERLDRKVTVKVA